VVDGFNGRLHGGIGGDDHNLDMGVLLLGLLQKFQSCRTGHCDICHNQVVRVLLDELGGGAPVVGGVGHMAQALDAPAHEFEQANLVVGDQDLGLPDGGHRLRIPGLRQSTGCRPRPCSPAGGSRYAPAVRRTVCAVS
jgi:hypothetical protein